MSFFVLIEKKTCLIDIFEAVKEELDKITEIQNIESLVLSKEYKYVGRPDLICVYVGKLSIIDLNYNKTKCENKNGKNQVWKLKRIATNAYEQAYSEMSGYTINNYLIIYGFLNDSKVKIIWPKTKNYWCIWWLGSIKKTVESGKSAAYLFRTNV